MSVALGRRLGHWAADWARRRQGPDASTITLERRRIYILPTRFGLIFAFLVFAMLLGAMNYATSLGFALTFLLGGLGLVVMHHCHNNLLRAEVRFTGAPPVFAGEQARFRIAIANPTALPRYEIEAAVPDHAAAGPVDVDACGLATLTLGVPARHRGWLKLPGLSVETRHPGGLFRAWTWVHMDARCLVYPAPAPAGRPAPASTSRRDTGTADGRERGNADFVGLRAAAPGDSPRHMAWKAYARNAQLLVKQFAGAEEPSELFDWEGLTGLDTEPRLMQLTRWCLDAWAAGRAFGLRLPSREIPIGSGERHLHECLEALALFDEPGRPPRRP
jgi:uncharacterized protein (DUF58 family)